MKKITKTALAILLSLCLCIGMVPAGMLSAGAANGDSEPVGFSPDNFKAQIKKVSIGAPITGLDGKKYLPVDVHFFAAENLSDSDVAHFLEGYLKVQLKDGKLAESIRSLGMTLIGPVKPDVTLDSNMWNWDWTPYDTGGGQGVIKYNVPLLDEGETQTVEKSLATGMTEVNGVTVGDKVTVQNETVVNTNGFPEQIVQELFPDGPSVFSDPVTFTVEEASKYPKEITISTDDKTVAPPQEVVLPYTGQPQECPYKATAGYTVSLNDPQTDAGIYTAALILNSGWKWTDGTSFRYDDRIRCKNTEHPVRQDHADPKKDQSAGHAELYGHSGQLADRFCPHLPPVLRGDDDERISNRDRRLLHEEKDLVYSSRTGECRLAVAAEHDIIGHVDTVGHYILQRHHCHQAEKGLVKAWIVSKKVFFWSACV